MHTYLSVYLCISLSIRYPSIQHINTYMYTCVYIYIYICIYIYIYMYTGCLGKRPLERVLLEGAGRFMEEGSWCQTFRGSLLEAVFWRAVLEGPSSQESWGGSRRAALSAWRRSCPRPLAVLRVAAFMLEGGCDGTGLWEFFGSSIEATHLSTRHLNDASIKALSQSSLGPKEGFRLWYHEALGDSLQKSKLQGYLTSIRLLPTTFLVVASLCPKFLIAEAGA